jgi:hypothetical protein
MTAADYVHSVRNVLPVSLGEVHTVLHQDTIQIVLLVPLIGLEFDSLQTVSFCSLAMIGACSETKSGLSVETCLIACLELSAVLYSGRKCWQKHR